MVRHVVDSAESGEGSDDLGLDVPLPIAEASSPAAECSGSASIPVQRQSARDGQPSPVPLKRGHPISSDTATWAAKRLKLHDSRVKRGPNSVKELNSSWPMDFLASIEKAGLLQNVIEKLAIGVTIESDYSGAGSMEQAAAMIRQAADRIAPSTPQRPNFKVYRVCDSDYRCRAVLRRHAPEPEHCEHSFSNICDRVDPDTLKNLEEIWSRWSAQASACSSLSPSKSDAMQTRRVISKAMCDEMLQVLDDAVLVDAAFCCTQDKVCKVFSDAPIVVSTGGNLCLDWSSYGKMEHWSGQDTIPFFIWCFCIKRTLPLMFIQECTPQFDLSILRSILGDHYNIQARRICPTMLGAGCMRLRQWSVGFLKEKVDIVTDGFDSDLFVRLFHRVPVLRADDYFVAPEDARAAAVAEISGRRIVAPMPTACDDEPLILENVLSPGAMCRLGGYKRMAKSGKYVQERVLAAIIVQNPDTRPWLHKRLQTLLRGSEVVLIRSDKLKVGEQHERKSMLMTADEHLMAMGWPLFHQTDTVNLLEPALVHLDADFKKHLAGNAMHVMVAGAVLLFCLVATKVRAPLPTETSHATEDQNGEVF